MAQKKSHFYLDKLISVKFTITMKTFEEIKEVIDKVTYKEGWSIKVFQKNKIPFIQVIFMGADETTGMIEEQKCRKWSLSYHMTTTEIVYTVLKAIQAAEDHETREFFKYKGVRIANPHFSVEDIVGLVKSKELNEQSRLLETNK